MDGSYKETGENKLGGMISLARFVTEHYEAIDYDLLTKTGMSLSDVGGRLSWSALYSFITKYENGALLRELSPEIALWDTTAKTNVILADIFDMLAAINANLCAKGSGRRPKRPKPYPRPKSAKEQRKIGKPMPIDELHKRIFGK